MQEAAKAPKASPWKNPDKSIQTSFCSSGQRLLTEDTSCTKFHTVSKLDLM
jgi:hypothetical protein